MINVKYILKVVITDNKGEAFKIYKKEVNFPLSVGLFINEGIRGKIQDCTYENGVFEGVIIRKVDLMKEPEGFNITKI